MAIYIWRDCLIDSSVIAILELNHQSNVLQCSVLSGSTEYFIYSGNAFHHGLGMDDVTRSVFLSEFTCGTGMEVPERPVNDRG